ncbi:TetR/AcrR family transcriptional regulator [Georgenia thermotolerans]|uniref:TetR family transcriptional regulator n=1 Tax=Georgenia thermotolerans TaxID=527326 RepID=A0A7J5UTE6_9MICO|nr:TetR/AcrR family transcriptional regulator [Georgenia thermotolerans]KAE8765548.1 TetR family transcriptional regulator [Georgenia thermotolerans]
MATPEKMGLRERKKHLTRETIADAALALSVERGLANVTLDEIANLAFVSARTVSNYFSCKEEAVARAGAHDLLELVDAFTLRPADEPPMDALRQVLIDFAASLSPERLRVERQKLEVEQEYPALHPYQVAQYDELEASLREAIAARTHTNGDTDVYPWIAAAAAVSAISSSIRLWARTESGPEALPELIGAAFDQIAGGLRPPSSAEDGAHASHGPPHRSAAAPA